MRNNKLLFKMAARAVPLILLLLIPSGSKRSEFPVYRVVLDAGHGGKNLKPLEKNGDRYDSISGKYLDKFKEGASYRGLHEHLIVYSLAEKVQKILNYCRPGGEYSKFYTILKKYTDEEPRRVYLEHMIARPRSITEEEAAKKADPNADYRMFDYPDKNGVIQKGRLSKMNDFKPQLVVSLHLAQSGPPEYKGINPVLVPSFKAMHQGLQYLRGVEKSNAFFKNSYIYDWFEEANGRSSFEWFKNDVSMYFTGYPIDREGNVKLKDFKGYRMNMVSWPYRDEYGWERTAKQHPMFSRYSPHFMDIKLEGKYWDRERSIYEEYKRSDGAEGYGGDNCYASYEITRFLLYSLYLAGSNDYRQVPGKPYVSIWIVPLHVNAINAFMELGYFNRARDRYLLTEKQDEMAEGIAVGIYSLFAGIKVKDSAYKHLPKGAGLDLDKYRINAKKTYFDVGD